jgi:hypothetical protein
MTDNGSNPTHSAALDYHRRLGLKVIATVGKNPAAPMGEGWQTRPTTEDDLARWFANGTGYNVGIQWGSVSGNRVDVDLDCRAATAVADSLLPPTGWVFGRPKHPRSHRTYRVDRVGPSIKLEDPATGHMQIELRGENLQTVVPPSRHEKTGEVITWESFTEPAEVTYDDLARAVRQVGAACLIARHLWPKEKGGRHGVALALGGALAHAGYPLEDAKRLVKAAAHAVEDDEPEDRLKAVETSYEKKEAGELCTGWPTLGQMFPDKGAVLDQVSKWLGISPDKGAKDKKQKKGRVDVEDAEDVELVVSCLADVKPQPITWLVPDVLPLGKLVLLAGDGGHGKSTLTLHLAACLSKGLPAFGMSYDRAKTGDTLFIQCEDDYADTVVPRLLAAGADRNHTHQVEGIRGKDGKLVPFNLAYFQALERELENRPEVRLVVIDPAGAYVGSTGVDDYKDSELRALLGPLAEMAARRRVCIILIKHLIKGTAAKAVHKVSGSAGYVNTVRAAFVVVPSEEDPDRKLFLPLKFNPGRHPEGRAYRFKSISEDARQVILDAYGGHLDEEARTQLGKQLVQLEWEVAPVSTTADDAFAEAGQRGKAGKDVERAAEWLTGFLAGGPQPSDLCVSQGNKALGLTRQLKWWRDAVLKAILGGQPRKLGFGAEGQWYFTLPSHAWPPAGAVHPGKPGGVVVDNDPPGRSIIPFPGVTDAGAKESKESKESKEGGGGSDEDSLGSLAEGAGQAPKESTSSPVEHSLDSLDSLDSLAETFPLPTAQADPDCGREVSSASVDPPHDDREEGEI